MIELAEYRDRWCYDDDRSSISTQYIDDAYIYIERPDGNYSVDGIGDVVRTTEFSGGDGRHTPKEYITEYMVKNLEITVHDMNNEEIPTIDVRIVA